MSTSNKGELPLSSKEIVNVNQQPGASELLDGEASGQPMEPQRQSMWLHRTWKKFKTAFTMQNDNTRGSGGTGGSPAQKTTRRGSDERGSVAGNKQSAIVVGRPTSEPPLTYKKSRYPPSIGGLDGHGTSSPRTSHLWNTHRTHPRSLYGSMIGTAGRYNHPDDESEYDTRLRNCADIKMAELGSSGSSLEIEHGHVNIFTITKTAETDVIIQKHRDFVSQDGKGDDVAGVECTINKISDDFTTHVKVDEVIGTSSSGKKNCFLDGFIEGGVDPAKQYVKIRASGDAIKVNSLNVGNSKTENISAKPYVQSNAVSGAAKRDATDVVDKVKPYFKLGDVEEVGGSCIKRRHIGGSKGHRVEVLGDCSNGQKSIVKVSGGFGGGSVIEKDFSGGPTIKNDRFPPSSGIICGRSSTENALICSTGSLTSSNEIGGGSSLTKSHIGGSSPTLEAVHSCVVERDEMSDPQTGSRSTAETGYDEGDNVTYVIPPTRWERYTPLGPNFK